MTLIDNLVEGQGTVARGAKFPCVLTCPPAGGALDGAAPLSAEELQASREALLRVVRRRFCGSEEDAEDVVQETLLRAWRSRDRYDSARSLLPWLVTIAQRLVIDQSRKAESKIQHVPVDGVVTERVSVSSPEPGAEAERIDLRAGIERAADGLSTGQRRLLRLRTVEELSYSEIATRIGTTETAVKPALSRARARFRDGYLATGAPTRIAAVLGLITAGGRRVRFLLAGGSGGSAASGTVVAVAVTCCAAATFAVGLAAVDVSSQQPTHTSGAFVDVANHNGLTLGPGSDPSSPTARGLEVVASTSRAGTDSGAAGVVPGLPVLGGADVGASVEGDGRRVGVTDSNEDPIEDDGDGGGGETVIECVDPEASLVTCRVISLVGPRLP